VITKAARFQYAAALDDADRPGALALVDTLLLAGVDPLDLLLDLIAPAQVEVGLRWQRGEYTVAEEHGASAVSEAAVAAIGAWIREPVRPTGRALVACAEREWHALAARIVAESLRHLGWHVTFLGASTPARLLAGYLNRLEIDVVAVSCSGPAGLPAARQLVEAAAEAGVPLLAGGRAFGTDDSRARAIGAAGWAESPRLMGPVLAGLEPVSGELPPLGHAGALEQAELLLRSGELATRVTAAWRASASGPGPDCLDGLGTNAGHSVDHALAALAAALLLDDPTLLTEAKGWVGALFGDRGCPPEAASGLWAAVTRELAPAFPAASALLEAAP
jgi:methanogenic corrinoid protein MtbC1